MKRLILCCVLMSACHATNPELPVILESTQVPPSISEKNILLLDAPYVLKTLGEPTVRRKENVADIWVYNQNSCTLFVYFSNQEQSFPIVKHMEIGFPNATSKEKISEKCLSFATKLR